MATEFICLSDQMSVMQTLLYLQKEAQDAEMAYYLYVVDQNKVLTGVVSLREIVAHSFETLIRDIANPNVISVPAPTDQEEVARIFSKYNFLMMPVVDEQDRILGVITVDDVMDIIEEENTEDIHRLAQINEEEKVGGSLIESLKSGKGQLIAAGMTATPERAEQIDFSITYTLNGLILLVPKGSDIKTADDLAGKNIAVQESTTAHIYAQEELGIEPLAFKNANECATAVMGGKADAAILDKVPAQTLAMANPDALETVEQLLTEEEMAMGVAKGNEDLLEVVNSVLQKAMDDGTVESLTDKHLKICAEG